MSPDDRLDRQGIGDDLAYFLARGYVTGAVDLGSALDESYVDWAPANLPPYSP